MNHDYNKTSFFNPNKKYQEGDLTYWEFRKDKKRYFVNCPECGAHVCRVFLDDFGWSIITTCLSCGKESLSFKGV